MIDRHLSDILKAVRIAQVEGGLKTAERIKNTCLSNFTVKETFVPYAFKPCLLNFLIFLKIYLSQHQHMRHIKNFYALPSNSRPQFRYFPRNLVHFYKERVSCIPSSGSLSYIRLEQSFLWRSLIQSDRANKNKIPFDPAALAAASKSLLSFAWLWRWGMRAGRVANRNSSTPLKKRRKLGRPGYALICGVCKLVRQVQQHRT